MSPTLIHSPASPQFGLRQQHELPLFFASLGALCWEHLPLGFSWIWLPVFNLVAAQLLPVQEASSTTESNTDPLHHHYFPHYSPA